MTDDGYSNVEINNFIDNYIAANPETVIKAGEGIEYYREQADITEKLNAFMLKNEYEINEFIIYWLPVLENNKYNYIRFRQTDEIRFNYPYFNLKVFYNRVRAGQEWDLKKQDEWQTNTSMLIYDNQLIDFDAAGNINYGYMGSVYMISPTILSWGAGYAQVRAGNTKLEWLVYGVGDDPIDQMNIRRGVDWYKKVHGCEEN